MKVIKVDNFDRDTVDDELVAEGLTEQEAKDMAEGLNQKFGGDYAPWYYKAVTDDKKLHVWNP